MKILLSLSALTLCLFALFVTGCGGNSTSSLKMTPGVQLTFNTDTTVPHLVDVAAKSTETVSAQLDDGAKVELFDFRTGLLLRSGVLKSGACAIDITSGLTVAVVITGKRTVGADVKNYRLSMLIPMVPNGNAAYTLTPVTSVAAEAVASAYYKAGKVLDWTSYSAVLDAALHALDTANIGDFSLGGGIMKQGTSFGEKAGVFQTPAAMADVVTEATKIGLAASNLVIGKNVAEQVREIGMPMTDVLAQEGPSLDTVKTATMSAANSAMQSESIAAAMKQVVDKYGVLASRTAPLLMPIVGGAFSVQDESYHAIDTLPMGTGYSVEFDEDHAILLVENSQYAHANQVTIVWDKGAAGTATLVITHPNATTWHVEQTDTSDAELLYTYTANNLMHPTIGKDPVMAGAFTFADKDISSLTFSGTLSATGEDEDNYTQIALSGAIHCAELNGSAAVTVNFPTRGSLPPNAKTVYLYPTSLSAEIPAGGALAVTATDGTALTATLTGKITVTTTPMQLDDQPIVLPTAVALTNGLFSVTQHNGSSFSLKGSGGLELAATQATHDIKLMFKALHFDNIELHTSAGNTSSLVKGSFSIAYTSNQTRQATTYPTLAVKLQGGQIASTVAGKTISLSGEINIQLQVLTSGEFGKSTRQRLFIPIEMIPLMLPTSVYVSGAYSNTITGVTFTGLLDAKWNKPSLNLDITTMDASLLLRGSLQKPQRRVYDLDTLLVLDGKGMATCTLTNALFGAFSMKGGASGEFYHNDGNTRLRNLAVNLTNQDNAKLHLETDAGGALNGSITVNGELVTKSIKTENGLLTITYTDNTIESLPALPAAIK